MKAGDRARFLVSRGADRYEGADLSVSAAFHQKEITRVQTRTCVISTIATSAVAIVIAVSLHIWLFASSHLPLTADIACKGGTGQHPSSHCSAASTKSHDDAAALATVLAYGPHGDPDPRWATALQQNPELFAFAPSRLEALNMLLSRFAAIDRTRWPAILSDIEIDVALTPVARTIIDALRSVPGAELSSIPTLIEAILKLPSDRRSALERAGFPVVPAGNDRQEIYRLIGSADADTIQLVGQILTDRVTRIAMHRVQALLQVPAIPMLLGGLADGSIQHLPFPTQLPTCDIGRPGSCNTRPR